MRHLLTNIITSLALLVCISGSAHASEIDSQIAAYMDQIHLFQGYSISAPEVLQNSETQTEIQSLIAQVESYGFSLVSNPELKKKQLLSLENQIDQCLDALGKLLSA